MTRIVLWIIVLCMGAIAVAMALVTLAAILGIG